MNDMSRIYPIISIFIVLFVGVFISTHFQLYDKVFHFDKIMHFTGGFIVAWFFIAVLGKELRTNRAMLILLLVSLTTFVGVLWEFTEFSSGEYLKDKLPWIGRYFYGGNLKDTLLDLLFDMMGSIAFAIPAVLTRAHLKHES
jgi:hypothetical protein